MEEPSIELFEAIDRNFEDKNLPVNKLKVDLDYQRPLEPNRLAKMQKFFDAGAVRQIFVSDRGKSQYYVIDGQHTVELLKLRNIKEVYCRVFVGLSKPEEALMFESYNINHKRPTSLQLFNAALAGGKVDAVEINEVLDKYGLYLGSRSTPSNDDEKYPLVAVKAVANIYAVGGQILLSATFSILLDAWGKSKNSLSKELISGLGYFLWNNVDVDEGRLIGVLSLVPPSIVLDRAWQNASTMGASTSKLSSKQIARAIAEIYREGNPPAGYDKIRQNSQFNVWPISPKKKATRPPKTGYTLAN